MTHTSSSRTFRPAPSISCSPTPPNLFDGINFIGWRVSCKSDIDTPTLKNGVDNDSMLPELVRVLKKRGGCAVWCNKAQIPGYLDFFKGWKFEVFVWIKTNVPPLYGNCFLHDKEYLLVFWRNGRFAEPIVIIATPIGSRPSTRATRPYTDIPR